MAASAVSNHRPSTISKPSTAYHLPLLAIFTDACWPRYCRNHPPFFGGAPMRGRGKSRRHQQVLDAVENGAFHDVHRLFRRIVFVAGEKAAVHAAPPSRPRARRRSLRRPARLRRRSSPSGSAAIHSLSRPSDFGASIDQRQWSAIFSVSTTHCFFPSALRPRRCPPAWHDRASR